MKERVLASDFDGFVTNAEKGAIPFRKGWESGLAEMTGIPLAKVRPLMRSFEKEIINNPTAYAWEMNGRKIAPAVVDPYIRATVATRKLFDAMGLFPDNKEQEEKCQELFTINYPKSATVFRPGARKMLAEVQRVAHAHIITNSRTEPVLGKLEGRRIVFPPDRVHGSAKKYEIDPEWTGVPEFMHIPGLSRPVLLHRKRYYDVLERICRLHWIQLKDLTAVGDIFELDLALLLALGCRVGLLANEFTPQYEIDFLLGQDQSRVRVFSALHEVVPFVLG